MPITKILSYAIDKAIAICAITLLIYGNKNATEPIESRRYNAVLSSIQMPVIDILQYIRYNTNKR